MLMIKSQYGNRKWFYKKRKNKIEDYLNKTVSLLMNKCKEEQIDEIIIGYNKGLKSGGIKNTVLKGKKKRQTNQNFIQLPISRFKDKIELKGKENNIEVRIINEAYTSKSSFYDNDPIEKDKYSGIRIKRGLYQTRENKIVNADINAALNIYKKYKLKSNSKDDKIDYLMSRGITIPSRVIVKL